MFVEEEPSNNQPFTVMATIGHRWVLRPKLWATQWLHCFSGRNRQPNVSVFGDPSNFCTP